MCRSSNKPTGARITLAGVILTGLLSGDVLAQSHPQEVLDLISAHEALAMKIRPLQDRVVVSSTPTTGSNGFNPEGVPIRARTNTENAEGDAAVAERRVPETLQHRDRAAATDADRLAARVSALENKARVERERISRPGFGTGSAQQDAESGTITFGDGRRGARLPATTESHGRAAAGAAASIDAAEISEARRALASLEREFAALEQEADAMGRR